MAAHTTMIHVRVDDDTKEKATVALNAMGLSVSEAIRLFLNRVVAEQAFPLELKVPNAETVAAMQEAREIVALSLTRFATAEDLMSDLEKSSRQ